ncbi:MAG: hypothetical protein AAF517_22390, partial [Planctomycetota bacterium]
MSFFARVLERGAACSAGFALAGLSCAVALLAVLTTSVWYDDEGYVMLTVKSWIEGHALYSEVYTQYGPFYYLYRSVVHEGLALPVSHDINRVVAAVEWLMACVFVALAVRRMTGSGVWAAVAGGLSFSVLEVVSKEAGHPQVLCAILSWVPLLVLAVPSARLSAWRVAAAGIFAGFALMTKVNVGIFVIEAVGLACIAAWGGAGALRPVRHATFFVAALLPFLLVGPGIEHLPNLAFAGAAAGGVIALGIATARSTPSSSKFPFQALVLCGGVVAAVALCIGVAETRGTAWQDVLYGVWTRPQEFAASVRDLVLRFPVYDIGAGVASPILAMFLRRRPSGRAIAGCRIVFALSVLVGVLGMLIWEWQEPLRNGMSLRGGVQWVTALAAPFAWLVVRSDKGSLCFGRCVLAATATSQSLLCYPIYGSQVSIAAVPTLLAAVVCLSDGLRAFYPIAESVGTRRVAPVRWASAGLLAAVVVAVGLRANALSRVFESNVALDLPGATLLRFEEHKANEFRGIAKELANNCDTFYSILGTNSLYFWSTLSPPTHWNATAWPNLLTTEEQEATVAALEAHGRVGLVEDVR